MSTDTVVDLFAGPGGWDVGALEVGLDPIGIELDRWACETRAAAGLRTIRGSVDAQRVPALEGLIASPPCTAFSQAGKRAGHKVLDDLVDAVGRGDWTWGRDDYAPTTWLVLEVGRWIEEGQPTWIALEQVPSVLPVWNAYAEWLRSHGWNAEAGCVSAEQYGVAQTRKRAILVAHRDRKVGLPTPTHQRYEARSPDKGRHGLLAPWVSMADALGWDGAAGFPRKNDLDDGAEYRERDMRPTDLPAFGVTEKARSWTVSTGANTMKHSRDNADIVPYERQLDDPAPTVDAKAAGAWKVGETGHREPPMKWKVQGTPQANAVRRDLDEPAPGILGGNSAGNLTLNTGRDWKKGGTRADAQTRSVEPSPAMDSQGGKMRWDTERLPGAEWANDRPATTVTCDSRVPRPGHHGPEGMHGTQDAADAARAAPRPPAPLPEDQQRLPGLPEHGVTAEVADRKPWADERPATTIAGRDLVPDPGANANRFNGATKSRNDGIKVGIEEVLILQSFPPDYPLRGTRTEQFRQVGNAIPPLLAAHILAAVTGRNLPWQ